MNLVEQAITEHWGEKCDSYEQGCPVCDAWREYENLVTYGASAVTHEITHARVRQNLMVDEMVRAQIDPEIRDAITKIILENNVSKP